MLLRTGFAQTTLRYGLRLVHPVTYNRKPVHKPRSKEKRDLGYEVSVGQSNFRQGEKQ